MASSQQIGRQEKEYNATSLSVSPLTKNGVLYKKRKVLKTWKPRFFELDDDILKYYRITSDFKEGSKPNFKSPLPVESIYLPGCSIESHGQKILGDSSKHPDTLFLLTISHPSSTIVYKLGAMTKSEQGEWVSLLLHAASKVSPSLIFLSASKFSDTDSISTSETTLNRSQQSSTSIKDLGQVAPISSTPQDSSSVERFEPTSEAPRLEQDPKTSPIQQEDLTPQDVTAKIQEDLTLFSESMEDWMVQRIKGIFHLLLEMADSDDGWDLNFEKQGVRCYIKRDRIVSVKGQGDIPFPPQLVFQWIYRPDGMPSYDAMLEYVTRIQSYDCHNDHSLFNYKGIWPTAGRDISLMSHWRIHDDGRLVVASTSIPHPDIPEVSGVVRAEVHVAGWILEPINDGHSTRATYLVKTDLKGSLPKRIVDLASSQQPMLVAALRKFLEDRYKSGIPDVGPLTNECLEDFMSTLFGRNGSSSKEATEPCSDEEEGNIDLAVTRERQNSGQPVRSKELRTGSLTPLVGLLFLPVILPYLCPTGLQGVVFLLSLVWSVRYLVRWYVGVKPEACPAHGTKHLRGQCVINSRVGIGKLVGHVGRLRHDGEEVTLMHAIIRALALALKENPRLLGSVWFGEWIPLSSIDISCIFPKPGTTNESCLLLIEEAEKKSMQAISTEARIKTNQTPRTMGQCGGARCMGHSYTAYAHRIAMRFLGFVERFLEVDLHLTYFGCATIVSSQCDTKSHININRHGVGLSDVIITPSETDVCPIVVSIGGVDTDKRFLRKQNSRAAQPLGNPYLNISVSCSLRYIQPHQLRNLANRLQHHLENFQPESADSDSEML